MKRIAIERGMSIDRGERWHVALLDAFTAGDGQTPPLIDAELRPDLDLLRRFRHVFRNLYAEDVDWAQVEPVAAVCDRAVRAFFERVERATVE